MKFIVRGDMTHQALDDVMRLVERGGAGITEIDDGEFEVDLAPVKIADRSSTDIIAAVWEGLSQAGHNFSIGRGGRQHNLQLDHRGRLVGIKPAVGNQELTPEAVRAAALELAHRFGKTEPRWRALGDALRDRSLVAAEPPVVAGGPAVVAGQTPALVMR